MARYLYLHLYHPAESDDRVSSAHSSNDDGAAWKGISEEDNDDSKNNDIVAL